MFILETAVRDGKVMQGFDSESLKSGGSHSRLVKGPPLLNDSESKDCVNLPSPTAVSRFIALPCEIALVGTGSSSGLAIGGAILLNWKLLFCPKFDTFHRKGHQADRMFKGRKLALERKLDAL